MWAGLVNLPTRNFAVDELIMLYVGKAGADGQNAALARGRGLAWLVGRHQRRTSPAGGAI